MLSLLIAATVVVASLVTAAHGLGAEPDAKRAEVHVGAVGALGLVELDEEQETAAPSLPVTLVIPRARASLGLPATGNVGPARGHVAILQRPPSAS